MRELEPAASSILGEEWERVLSLLAKGLPVAVADEAGRIVFANDALCVLAGVDRGHLLGRDLRLLPAGHDREVPREIEAAIAAGGLWRCEAGWPDGARALRRIDITVAPLPGAVSGPGRFLATYHEAMGAVPLDAPRAGEQHFRSLVQMAPNAIFLSEGGVTSFVNEAGVALFRARDPAQILGRTLFELFHPDSHEDVRRQWAILRGGPASMPSTELRIAAMDGTTVPVEVRAVSYMVEGRLVVQAICQDITERKIIEQRLLEERDYADAVLDCMPGIFYHFDEHQRLRRWNKNFEEVTGFSPEELATMCSQDFHPPEDKPLIAERVAEVFDKGQSQAEADFLTRDGRLIPYLFTGVRFEQDGRPGFVGIGTDISERRRIEQQVREQRDYADAVLDTLPGVFYHFDENLRLSRWNRNLERISGYSADEVRGCDPRLFFYEAEHELIAGRIGEVFEKGYSFVEANYRLKDGSSIPYLFTGVRFELEGKQGFVGVGTDMSERHKFEGELRESVARFHAAARATGDVVWDWELPGDTIWWSDNIHRLFGYSAEEIGLTTTFWSDRIHPAEQEEVLAGLRAVIDGGQDLWEAEYRFRRKDGSYAHVSDRGYVLRDEAGRGLRMIGAIQDITEHRRVQAQLRAFNVELEQRVAQRTQELQAINGELESFCYSVSHDLRAPLRGIAGFAEILARDHAAALDETARDYLGRVLAAAGRMGELIDDLLGLSRVSRNEMHHEPVDLSALARDVLAGLRAAEPERRVEISVEDGLSVVGDARLLRVMLDNLLDNAWKFTSKTPDARIGFAAAGEDDGRPAFEVSDNGAGFDMQYAGKLFAPFQRLHRMTEFPGTGIGLATVQRIVGRHGGRISARAAPGRGATFTFTL